MKIIEKIEGMERKKYTILILFALSFFFLTRIFALDQDLPPWGIINYQPVDEGAYVLPALNMYNYGDINPHFVSEGIYSEISPHVKANIVGNVFTYIGMKLLGDNYYGFRMGSVVCTFLIYIITILNLVKLESIFGKDIRIKRCMTIIIGLYLLIDFCFMMAGRVVETTIYRLLFIQIITCIFLHVKKKSIKYGLMGFFAAFSVFGIYITNIFIYLAFAITLFGIWKKEGRKSFLQTAGSGITGSFLGLILCEIYYYICWDTFAIKNMLDAFSSFSSQTGYEVSSGSWIMIRSITHMVASNINMYNVTVFFICIIGIPIMWKKITSDKEVVSLFLISLCLSYMAQTLVTEDYVVRKYLIIYPTLIYILYIILCTIFEKQDRILELTKRQKMLYSSYVVLCSVVCVLIPIFRFFIISNETQKDFLMLDKCLITGTIVCVLLCLTIGSFQLLWYGKLGLTQRLLLASLCITILLNVYMDYSYIWENRTYSEKKCMVDLGSKANGKYVIGAFFPMGYTLYNEAKMVLCNNEDIKDTLQNNKSVYYLDYSYKEVSGYLESVFGDCKYRLVGVEEFEREFQTFGKKRNIQLFRATENYYGQ